MEWGFLFYVLDYTYNKTIMNNSQKAERYNQLMLEYTRIQNRISSIKGESINLDQKQMNDVRQLENRLREIMNTASRL